MDGIRIGELSAVTRLRMTSMVAKHCSENSVVYLFARLSGDDHDAVREAERGLWGTFITQQVSPTAHLTSLPTLVKKERTFGR